MNKFRKLAGAALAAILVSLFVIVPAQLSAPQAAHALAGCYPPSTINPACQPLNAPILLETGVISGSGTGAGTTAGVGGGGGFMQLILNGGAGLLGMLGFGFLFIGNDGAVTDSGHVGIDGVGEGMIIKTDPAYLPPLATSKPCKPVSGRSPIELPWTGSSSEYSASGPGSTRTINNATYAPVNVPQNCPAGTNTFTAYNLEGQSPSMFNLIVGTTSITTQVTTASAQWNHAQLYPRFGIMGFCRTGSVTTIHGMTSSNGTNFNSGSAGYSRALCPGGERAGIIVQVRTITGTINSYVVRNPYTTLLDVPAEPDGNVGGELRTTVECLRMSDGATLSVVGSSLQTVAPGLPLTIPSAKCPPGYIADTTKIDIKPPGETGFTPIVDPIHTPAPIKELPVQFPSCYPPPDGNPCTLTLWQVKPGGGLDSCGTNGELCIGWAQAPGAYDQYQCFFGPYPIELDKCSAYRYPQIGPLPNTAPDGTTIPITAPAPNPLPNPLKNPQTGVPVPIPTTPLEPQIDPNGSAGNCFPTGWGVLNPVSWVVMPVQCALRWAFIPRPQVLQQQATQINNAWKLTPPALLTAAVTGWTFLPAPNGCDGITVSLFFLPQPLQIASACPGDMLAGLAGWSRFFGNVAFTIYGVVAVTRNLARIVEFPGLGGD